MRPALTLSIACAFVTLGCRSGIKPAANAAAPGQAEAGGEDAPPSADDPTPAADGGDGAPQRTGSGKKTPPPSADPDELALGAVTGTGLLKRDAAGVIATTPDRSADWTAAHALTATATDAGAAGTLVKRDASGGFSAGVITATVDGTATNVTGVVALANGGTGATTAAGARASLELGTAALRNSGLTAGNLVALSADDTLPPLDGSALYNHLPVGGGAAAHPEASCPTGYIPVPGDAYYGTTSFCVMKYEARAGSAGKGVESRATGIPLRHTVTWTSAVAACGNLGPGYALINNAEWMTIAVDIAKIDANWSGGAVGNGFVNSGHNDGDPGQPCEAVVSNVQGDCATPGSGHAQKRTHTLSNGAEIWDFAGNVWEWVDYLAVEDRPTPQGSFYREYSHPVVGTDDVPLTQLRPTQATHAFWVDTWDSAQGIGKYWAGANGSGGAMLRSGHWNDASGVGIFAAHFDAHPATQTWSTTGFRCVYR